MELRMPEHRSVTFNFFNNDNCTDFKFCQTISMYSYEIYLLLDMTPEERLKELCSTLKKNRLGKSCEFYFQGSFYPCGNVSDKDKSRFENMSKARKAKEQLVIHLGSEELGK
jgi:hypothetical protein